MGKMNTPCQATRDGSPVCSHTPSLSGEGGGGDGGGRGEPGGRIMSNWLANVFCGIRNKSLSGFAG